MRQRGRRVVSTEWDRQDIEAQHHRLRTVPIDDRLMEVLAWSAALLADQLERSGPDAAEDPDPVGLGGRLRP